MCVCVNAYACMYATGGKYSKSTKLGSKAKIEGVIIIQRKEDS